MSFPRLALLAVALGLFAVTTVSAQKKPPVAEKPVEGDVGKQKAAADENMKKSGVTTSTSTETDHLLVYTTLSEATTKAVAEAGEKAYDAAHKALKFEEKDRLWAGKLAVYYLPVRKDFTAFVRLVEQRKPDGDETQSVSVRGAEPYVLTGVAVGAKPTDAGAADEVATAIAAAVLNQKAGATAGTFALPSWLTGGFARATVLRTDGNAAKLAAFRAKQKALFGKAKAGTFAAAGLWGSGYGKDTDVLATSMAEFLAFGPPAENFTKFLNGFKPNEEKPMPTAADAIAAIDYKPETLDAAWKAWVAKQK